MVCQLSFKNGIRAVELFEYQRN